MKRYTLALLALLLPLPVAAQVCDWDATATGGARWEVTVDDSVVSTHTQQYQALEVAGRMETEDPARDTRIRRVLDLRVECPIPEAPTDTTTEEEPEPPAEDTTDAPPDTTATDTTTAPSGVQPVAVFDPDDYASSADLKSDPVEYLGNTDNMHLDTQVPAPGDHSSMRYDYIDQGPNSPISLGRSVPLPDSVKPVRELWVEAELRWSSNYMAIQNLPAGSIAAHKLIFGGSRSFDCHPNWQLCDGTGVGRWELIWPATAQNPPDGPALMGTPVQEPSSAGSVLHVTNSINTGDYYDEQWHTIRLHWRHDPGLYELWIDGVKMTSETQSGFTIHPSVEIVRVFLGRNKDDGIESGTESLWWGTVKVWTQDPGWW